MITLSDGITTLVLPDQMYWSDRYAWSVTEQTSTRSVTGALLIQSAARQYGRPITLEPAGGGWMLAAEWPQVQAWLDTPDQRLTLDFHGVAHTVQFRHADGGAEATSLWGDATPTPWIVPTFRFITVPPE